MVSILIAARNEAHTIASCLEAIAALLYPASQLEVLIGNDGSTDGTEAKVLQYIQDKPHFRLINITHATGNMRGKANVLAQLAKQSTGDYLFFTDADVQVPSQWIQTMLNACQPDTGIVFGITLISGTRLFARLQSLDWLYAQGLIQLAARFHMPVTALGNNMMVSRKAYQATGGYESLPFSVTEDFALFRAVITHRFVYAQVVNKQALAFTNPASGIGELLGQRKRWMKGAFQLPLYLILPLLIQALFLPLMIGLFFLEPLLAVGLLLCKILFQAVILLWMMKKLHQFRLLWYLFVFEPYYTILSFISLMYYFWPGKIVWKGRQY